MRSLQPRPVGADAPWRWARDALALIARRPAAFLAVGLVTLLVLLAALKMASVPARFLLVLTLPPLCLTGCLRLAEAADQGRPLAWSAWLPSNREALLALALAAVGYGLAFGAILLMADPSIAPGAGSAAGQDFLRRAFAEGGVWRIGIVGGLLFGISLTGFASLLLALFAWFAPPLLHAGCPPRQALALSFAAYRLNARRLGLGSAALLGLSVSVVVVSLGIAGALMAPFLGALLYVSYRDVFLGRPENLPVAARAAALPVGA